MDQLLSTISIKKQLEESRRDLLDLSTRNRLISIPIGSKSARLIQIFDEQSEEVYRRLISDKKTFTFLPGREQKKANQPLVETAGELIPFDDVEELVDLPLPDAETDLTTSRAKRHTDSKLQTRLSPEILQRRLFDLHNEARTIIEEQGVNILYLALGFLRWKDRSNSNDERVAPLILVPIDLIRPSIRDRFAIKWREEEFQENLSLAEKLNIEYDILLPKLAVDENESINLTAYFTNVKLAIEARPDWSVEADSMCVGFFSFAKFLMYKDLDSTQWPQTFPLLEHPLVRRLLAPSAETFHQEKATDWTETARLDERIPVERLDHVVDADSSQTIAIEMVREGKNLVIQGPPGTGKSQTITNIIATAVLDGKKVLFLAEKLAALEVVKQRLEREGLGVLCLELHSNKARKNTVAAELKSTWELGNPSAKELVWLNDSLSTQRAILNDHVTRLHTPAVAGQPTAFQHIGSLAYHGLPKGDELEMVFPGAESWSFQEISHHEALLDDIVSRLGTLGDVASHPWRGVTLNHYTGLEQHKIETTLRKLLVDLEAMLQISQRLAKTWPQDTSALTLKHLNSLIELAEIAGNRPVKTPDTLAKSLWDQSPKALISLAQTKQSFEQIVGELHLQVQSFIWKKDWSKAHQELALHGKKWHKFLSGGYRQAMKEISADLKIELPASFDQRLELVKRVLEGQQAYQTMSAKGLFGQEAFGILWEEEGVGSQLVSAALWIEQLVAAGVKPEERQRALSVDVHQMKLDGQTLKQHLNDFQDRWQWIESTLAFSLYPYTKRQDASQVSLLLWQSLLGSWLESVDRLVDWAAWQQELEQVRQSAIAPLIALVEQGKVPLVEIRSSFQRIVAQQQLHYLFEHEPKLAFFNGEIHNQKITAFKRIDQQRLELAKVNVLTKHFQHMPQRISIGAVGTVLGEVNRQRSHKPIRKLLSLAGSVVQDLKPVFMMSPLSVAQFLEPGKIQFDLLVIDEASQVKPVDALGAIARCRQIVVVGDDKQLPPSNFFSKLTSNDSDSQSDEEEPDPGIVKVKELESILSLGKARGLPDTLLRWHYRSKHHSLIAVSNRRYYENKLYIVPSPWQQNAGLGLVWHPVSGIYDRSNTRANALEAKAVAQAVIEHAIHHPQLTLGVAAFSMNQQRAIQDEVEHIRRQSPHGDHFFSQYPHEPFFVKNLENVQGDERDVIFLSIGYGRDALGKLSMNFGPLNRQGGERRLNVLISRARKRCEVFSSISDQDIELGPSTGEGVAGLKQFLQYARTGELDVAQQSNRPIGSPFEAAVKEALETRFGWEVHTQVGIAGFFIDLAVVDPQRKGRYVIGIECDGVAYHSSPSARERDRLRQSVLEGQGWIIHRLWGIDFFRKKEQELAKIKTAYDTALAELTEMDQVALVTPEEEVNVFYRQPVETASFAVPYQVVSQLPVPHPDPYLLNRFQVSELVKQILSIESPMHIDELTTRMREQWGWSKAGDKFRTLVSQGVTVLRKNGVIQQEGAYIALENLPVKVRVRGENAPLGIRKAVNIPPSEIDLALEHTTRQARVITREEAAKEVSVLMGFRAMSSDLRSTIMGRIDHLLERKVLREDEGYLSV